MKYVNKSFVPAEVGAISVAVREVSDNLDAELNNIVLKFCAWHVMSDE